MLKLSTVLIKASLALAALVAVATLGIMVVVASPPAADRASCALQEPLLSYQQGEEKTKVIVEASAPDCRLNVPAGTIFWAVLGSGERPLEQEILAEIQLNSDGSYSKELPINAAELTAPVDITVIGSGWAGPECETDRSCAALYWNMHVQPDRP